MNINILIFLTAYNHLSPYIQGCVVGVVEASGRPKIVNINILFLYVCISLYVYNNYLSISIQGRVVGVVGASGGPKIVSINILIYLSACIYQ